LFSVRRAIFLNNSLKRWPAEQLKSNLNTLVAEVPWLSQIRAGLSNEGRPGSTY